MAEGTSMETVSDGQPTAEVWVDHSTLRGEVSGSDTLYMISLKGRVDARWLELVETALAASTGRRGFRVDPAGATVYFSCRTVDGPGLVFDALEQLETLLALVNRQVQIWRSDPEVARVELEAARLRVR